MALIGNMQYLTIGDKTYRIASSQLPIASASTLGGIKVGTGLTIDSTTGVLSATGTSVTIDNALNGTSTNPVQNKVIKEALDDKADSADIPTKTSDLTNDSDFMSGMTILSYGTSTWNDFITAYRANHVVYCRASSNANPASGSQTRMAFMAYVSDVTNPTSVEFQYYRSVNGHTASQQGDQVYVYKLTSGNAWTVTVREASVKITTGSSNGINATYSNGAVTIGHTNSITAQSTQALYPITYDAQGHITGSGTAVTIPTVPTNVSAFTNDAGYLTNYTETDPTVPSWAKASSKPSYTFSEIGSIPTSLSGYGIIDAYTKTEVDGLVSGVLHYKGTKATISNLPSSGNITGDVWHITADGSEYAWDGSTWQELGTAVDLSNYVPTSRTINNKALTGNITLNVSSNTTGLSIADHATDSIIGVTSSTTTASKASGANGTAPTLGTAFQVPNVTSAGSGSFTQGSFNGGSFSQGTDSFTQANLTMNINSTDTSRLDITFNGGSFTQGEDSFTPATHGADSHTHIVPTFGTNFTIPNVTSTGSASTWEFTNVTVPIKDTVKTVVTGKTHSITDNGHTHGLS